MLVGMEIIAGVDPRMPLDEIGGYAARVEGLGYDGLHVPEMLQDPFVVSALALGSTKRLKVRTAVVLAFVRSPMATALAAWGLADMSKGRFDLGLGSQIRPNIEQRYGSTFDRPIARMRDYVAAVTACFGSFRSTEPLDHIGEFFQLTRLQPEFRPNPLADGQLPQIWLGAVGPQMLRLAGQVADGVITHPTNSHPADIERRIIPALAGGSDETGRERPPLAVGPLVATGPDARAVAEARGAIRRRLAFLYSTPAYRPTLDLLGFGDVSARLLDLTREGAWDRLDSVLSDDLLDQVVPTATWADLPELLSSWYGRIADALLIRPPVDPSTDTAVSRMIEQLKHLGSS